ncbi:hypothetical protein ARNL5_02917 [Anaerolineae bacterium]|nr:hypothetical protein ARNL5_02917 [Anaerolineae bacterium]
MAQNEMKAMRGMPWRVPSMEGLGRSWLKAFEKFIDAPFPASQAFGMKTPILAQLGLGTEYTASQGRARQG